MEEIKKLTSEQLEELRAKIRRNEFTYDKYENFQKEDKG